MYLSRTRRVVGLQRLAVFRFIRVRLCVIKRNRLEMKTFLQQTYSNVENTEY